MKKAKKKTMLIVPSNLDIALGKDIIHVVSAEEGTGIHENPHGLGKFYLSEDCTVTPTEAYDAMREGKEIEVPNAGAGSNRRFFQACGFTEIKDLNTGSSAGDWEFAAKDGPEGDWYVAFQRNRYPRHGFTYSVNFDMVFESFEQICKYMESL
jgi:hypothetical protein